MSLTTFVYFLSVLNAFISKLNFALRGVHQPYFSLKLNFDQTTLIFAQNFNKIRITDCKSMRSPDYRY